MERRYFISFISYMDKKFTNSWREIIWHDDFILEEVTKFLEKENNCTDVCILNFKELKKYEYASPKQEVMEGKK